MIRNIISFPSTDGLHYDPQTHWSGWIRNVYGLKQPPAPDDNPKIYNFMK